MPNLNMMTGGAGMGGARELAEMLRQMGRGPDKVLAHITPEEANMLIQAGGSGSINPNTGLPEFQPMYDDYDFSYVDNPSMQFENLPDMEETTPLPAFNIQPYQPPQQMMAAPIEDRSIREGEIYPGGVVEPTIQQPAVRTPAPLGGAYSFDLGNDADIAAASPTLVDRLERAGERFEKFAKERPTTTRLAGVGTNLLLSGLLARRAGRERERFAQELRQSAAPYAQAQQEALQRARGGGMTAAQQRAFDIAQARARQGLSAQNLGTGSAAAGIQSGQAARARSLARQESFDEAMNLAKIRDSYLREAARQELQADADLANALVGVLQGEIREATTTQATAPQQTRGRP
jgi:hypothetical protein